jgi:hypothetical protein
MQHHFLGMDNIRIACGGEFSWNQFLVASGFTGAATLELMDRVFSDHVAGTLDVEPTLLTHWRILVGYV